MRRSMIWIVILSLLLPLAAAGAETADDWMSFSSRTDALYEEVRAGYHTPVYAGQTQTFDAQMTLEVGQKGEVAIVVPEDAQYEVWFSYKNTTQNALPSEMRVTLDGELPFYEMQRVKLKSLWVDDGVFPLDRYGNQVATTPYAADVMQVTGLTDSAGRIDRPFLMELTAGEHRLGVELTDGGVMIAEVSLRAPETVAAYAPGDAKGDALIVIEGEQIASRNKSSIRGASEFSPTLSPYDIDKRMINYLDGASFDTAGDTVTYRFDAESEGWYQLGFYYRQSAKTDFPVFVDVRIDGALQSEASRAIPFGYRTSFGLMTVADPAGETQRFYLEKGAHEVSLTINCAMLTPVYETVDELLSAINGLSLEVVRLTGGVTSDKHRDYDLKTYIPNLEGMLNSWADKCDAAVEQMRAYTTSGSVGAFSNLTLCADQLRRLAEKPEDLPRRLGELSTGSNSASRMLAQQLQDLAVNDLSIDQIYFYQTDAKLPEKPGFIESTAKSVQRFVSSFSAQDYSASSSNKEHLQVWMGRSRQYVELVQNMIDTQFTPETGIEVDISLMPDANKLVLANAAGTAPDVVLSLQYVVPSYLDIRGALYDLTQFEDFGEVAQRFSAGLFIPYTLEDGVYAMPETVNFWVLFYRKDIMQALDIKVPDSMDEVKMILPELQRRNMNFYFPTAGMSGIKVFPGTLPLILQAGGSIYADTVADTTLDSEESLNGFREMTELFTVYNLPTDVPSPGFYQQFRDSTLPIGIADLGTYNLLLNAAPELDGLWDIALFPGLTDENGEVQRWTTGGAETMAILSQTQRPDDAWTFLKWWSSESVQSQFGALLQSTYGSEYIWPTANTAAFATLPLKSSHKQIIMQQMAWMTEAPWVLGTYMLERELSNAFISVVTDGTDARRALDTAVKRINRETYRKLEEFGYYKNGVMLREFPTPTVDVVNSYIDKYNEGKEATGK